MCIEKEYKYADFFLQRLESSIFVKSKIKKNVELIKNIDEACICIIKTIESNKKILFAGNGGSAADAQHLAGELVGKFYLEREPLAAISLNTNTSIISAIANDYSFDTVFSRQVRALGSKGDTIVGISTSGNSKNIILALREAKKLGIKTIGFTGMDGGTMKDIVDILINVPSQDTPRIQESHITIGHIICEIVEKKIFQKRK